MLHFEKDIRRVLEEAAEELGIKFEDITLEEQDQKGWEHGVFRPKYRELSDAEKYAVDDVKTLAAELLRVVNGAAHDSRCACLARTRLEEAVMWAVKSIT